MAQVNNTDGYQLLIVGGTGFIGYHLANKAIRLGWNVTVVGREKTSHQYFDNLNYIYHDLSKGVIPKLCELKDFDFVINLAGYIDHNRFFLGGSEVFKKHICITTNLINSLNVKTLKRFIQVGSSDEYGDNSGLKLEESKESPVTPYGASKLAATNLVRMLCKSEGFPATIFRPFSVYGPRQTHERLIPYLISACLFDRVVELESLSYERDFVFIDDLTDAIIMAFQTSLAPGIILNIGTGKGTSIEKVKNLVENICNKKIAYTLSRNSATLKSTVHVASTTQVRRNLNWRPKIDLETGIKSTIAAMVGSTADDVD